MTHCDLTERISDNTYVIAFGKPRRWAINICISHAIIMNQALKLPNCQDLAEVFEPMEVRKLCWGGNGIGPIEGVTNIERRCLNPGLRTQTYTSMWMISDHGDGFTLMDWILDVGNNVTFATENTSTQLVNPCKGMLSPTHLGPIQVGEISWKLL